MRTALWYGWIIVAFMGWGPVSVYGQGVSQPPQPAPVDHGSRPSKPAQRPTEPLNGNLLAETASLAPAVVSRQQWQAKPASLGMKPQVPVGIVLHHTAATRNLKASIETKLRNLQSFSQKPGQVSPTHSKPAWPDVPYHFYVDAAGRIAEGRNVGFAGDSNTNYNTNGYIQVVIEGDFEKEIPGKEQLSAVRQILTWLMLSRNISPDRISTHKDHAATTCPGRNFLAALPALTAQVKEQRSRTIGELCANPSGSAFTQTYCGKR
jgi:hypothetical protein